MNEQTEKTPKADVKPKSALNNPGNEKNDTKQSKIPPAGQVEKKDVKSVSPESTKAKKTERISAIRICQ